MKVKKSVPKKPPFLRGANLDKIRNLREFEVSEAIEEHLLANPQLEIDFLTLQDIYACALNMLPAKYIQKGSIVLFPEFSTTENDIKEAVRFSFKRVLENPKSFEQKKADKETE